MDAATSSLLCCTRAVQLLSLSFRSPLPSASLSAAKALKAWCINVRDMPTQRASHRTWGGAHATVPVGEKFHQASLSLCALHTQGQCRQTG